MTAKELAALLEPEVCSLSPEMSIVYRRYAIPPFLAIRLLSESSEPTFIIARAENDVVYYDDIEDEFGTGTLVNGIIQNGGTWGERLEWALRHFPRQKPNGPTAQGPLAGRDRDPP